MSKPSNLLGVFALLPLVACAHPKEPSTPTQRGEHAPAVVSKNEQNDTDPLSRANRAFHTDYDRLRDVDARALGTTRPFIEVEGAKVTLHVRGHSSSRVLFVEQYQDLKSLTHLPIAVATFAMTLPEGKPSGRSEARRRELALLTDTVSRDLSGTHFDEDVVSGSRHMLEETAKLLREIETRGRLPDARLREYGAAVRKDVVTNLTRAGRALVDALHAAVGEVRGRVSEAEWSQLVVVVATAHQARARETTVQYFERLLGLRVGEGAIGENRLIVTENLHGNSARKMAASHLTDVRLADILFGDPAFLQTDLLGKFIGPHLDELLPKAPAP